MEKIFTIQEVPISIGIIEPTKIDTENNNTVLIIQSTLLFNFSVPATEHVINEVQKITIDVSNASFGEFIPFDELKKELFYPLIIKEAEGNEEVLKKVKMIRYLTGLEAQPLKTSSTEIKKRLPFK